MRFTLTHVDGCLRADLYERETAEETRRFLEALAQEALAAGCDRVLIANHSTRAIFRVQKFGLPRMLELVASRPAHRIALVADRMEVRMAQQYVVTLARLKGLNVKSFGTERQALAWLKRAVEIGYGTA